MARTKYQYGDQQAGAILGPLLGTGDNNDPIHEIEHGGLSDKELSSLFWALSAPADNILVQAARNNQPVTPIILSNILAGKFTAQDEDQAIQPHPHSEAVLPHVQAIAGILFGNGLEDSLQNNDAFARYLTTQNTQNNDRPAAVAILKESAKGFFDMISVGYGNRAQQIQPDVQPDLIQLQQQLTQMRQGLLQFQDQNRQQQQQLAQQQDYSRRLAENLGELTQQNTQALQTFQSQQHALNQQNVQLRDELQQVRQQQQNQPRPPVQPSPLPVAANPHILRHGAAIKADIGRFFKQIEGQVPNAGTNDAKLLAQREEILRDIYSQVQDYNPSKEPSFTLNLSKIGDKLNPNQRQNVEKTANDLGKYILGVDQNYPTGVNVERICGADAANKQAVDTFALEQLQALAKQQEDVLKAKEKERLKKSAETSAERYEREATPAANDRKRQEKFEEKYEEKSVTDDIGPYAFWGGVGGFALGVAITAGTFGIGWPMIFAGPAIGAAVGVGAKAAVNKYQEYHYAKLADQYKGRAETHEGQMKGDAAAVAKTVEKAAELGNDPLKAELGNISSSLPKTKAEAEKNATPRRQKSDGNGRGGPGGYGHA